MEALFKMEKETKNMVRFYEVLESDYDTSVIGSIYIPKHTLKDIGWKEGDTLKIEVNVEGK